MSISLKDLSDRFSRLLTPHNVLMAVRQVKQGSWLDITIPENTGFLLYDWSINDNGQPNDRLAAFKTSIAWVYHNDFSVRDFDSYTTNVGQGIEIVRTSATTMRITGYLQDDNSGVSSGTIRVNRIVAITLYYKVIEITSSFIKEVLLCLFR